MAAAYYVAGKLAQLAVIPPGHFSPIYPAAGVTLAAVLVLGPRVWPGVVLGSFATTFSPALARADGVGSVVVPLVIGGGAALQTVVAAALGRRFMQSPAALERTADVVRVVALAPLACVTSSTIGVSTLFVTGIVQPPWLATAGSRGGSATRSACSS